MTIATNTALAYPEPPPVRDAETRLLLSVDEAAQTMGISRATVYELLASGELASLKIGARRLIACETIESFIARRLAGSDESAATGTTAAASYRRHLHHARG